MVDKVWWSDQHQTVHITSMDTFQLLTWRRRESGDIWFDIRREGWLHILVWRQVWRDVASWGHWRGWIAWHWGVRVVTHWSGRLYWRKSISKSIVLEVTSTWNMQDEKKQHKNGFTPFIFPWLYWYPLPVKLFVWPLKGGSCCNLKKPNRNFFSPRH